jgi:hypothetical protein
LNYVVADTAKWKQSDAHVIDTHQRVDAFVKNTGLGSRFHTFTTASRTTPRAAMATDSISS